MIGNFRFVSWPATLGLAIFLSACSIFDAPIGIQSVPRDAFPVFDNPEMLSGAEAEAKGMIRGEEPVIGVALNQEAKAYPISIMGVHELGNDTIGGVPIVVTW